MDTLKRYILSIVFTCCLLAGTVGYIEAQPDSDMITLTAQLKQMRVVVSARAFKAQGRSHWHLYLYRGDGTLIRQLTDGSGVDNFNPVFSPDGKTIAFSRTSAKYKNEMDTASAKIYLVSASGKKMRAHDSRTTAPDWYKNGISLPLLQPEPGADSDGTTDVTHTDALVYRDPSRRYEFVVSESNDDWTDREAWLRDVSTEKEDRISSIMGYGSSLIGDGKMGFGNVLFEKHSPWFLNPPLLAALFYSRLNSTDGTSYFALDPKVPEIYELSPNGAALYSIPNLPALFVLTDERYQSISDDHMTANCQYLDLWTPDFHRYRFSPKLAVIGGASIWYPTNSESPVYVHPFSN